MSWGKRADMTVHEDEPFNAEPSRAASAVLLSFERWMSTTTGTVTAANAPKPSQRPVKPVAVCSSMEPSVGISGP